MDVERNGTLDHARLIAAFGIVVFHAGAPGQAIGHAGLWFFVILLGLLGLPAARAQPFAPFAAARARRLLGPWLAWSAVYAALKLAEVAVSDRPLSAEFAPWMILTGPALHLWFLPFAWVASCALWGVARLPGAAPLLAAVAGFGVMGIAQGGGAGVPVAQWLSAVPPVCLGVVLALCGGDPVRRAAAVAGCVGLAFAAGWSDGLLQIAIAGAAVWACTAWPSPATAASDRAATLAMGVYLSHPLILSLLDRGTSLRPGSVAMALAACLGALALAALLRAPAAARTAPNRAAAVV